MEIIHLSKVDLFINSLEDGLRVEIDKYIDLLEQESYRLSMPFSKPLGNGLFELRITNPVSIRIFYCFHGNKVYLLHAFKKKQFRIPVKEMIIARKMYEFILHN